jgi:hypothetical protein
MPQPKVLTKYTAPPHMESLGQDHLNAVDGMLLSGVSPIAIAKHIHEEWGQLTEIKRVALVTALKRYRATVLDPKLQTHFMEKQTRVANGYAEARQFHDRVSALDRAEALVAMQWDRIQKVYEVEQKTPGLAPRVSRELKPFTEMVRVLGYLQLETGAMPRVPRTVSGKVTVEDDGDTVSFEVAISRGREVRDAARNMARILQGEYEHIPDDEDGGQPDPALPHPADPAQGAGDGGGAGSPAE